MSMQRSELEPWIRWRRDEAALGIERMEAVKAGLQDAYRRGWEAVDRATSSEEKTAAYADLLRISDEELAHLDKVEAWLSNSHEQIVGQFLETQSTVAPVQVITGA